MQDHTNCGKNESSMLVGTSARTTCALLALSLAAAFACSGRRSASDTATEPRPDGNATPEPRPDEGTATPATPDGEAGPDTGAAAVDGGSADATAPQFAVRWSVQSLFGGERIEITPDGQVLYVILGGPATGGQGQEYRGTATAAEMETLRRTFEENEVCELESERETGIPDEGHPTLQVALPGMECMVSMWDGEWLEREGPKACQEAVHAIARRLVPAAAP